MRKSYTYIWGFEVPPGAQTEFERHYGPDGTWARLFRHSPSYLGTTLLKDQSIAGGYLTIDRWQSEEAYRTFREDFSKQYQQLDSELEGLASTEHFVGAFTEVA